MAVEIDSEQQHGRWQPVGQGTVGSRIRSEIIRVIRERQLIPGDRLPPERELANLLRVSRPSVREAVRALESEGRLVVKPGQGVFVAEPATRRALQASLAKIDHDIAELYAMREVLEVPAARWAAERSDVQRLRLVSEAFDRLEAALAERPLDYDKLQRLDAAFHLSIVQASGNRFLEQTQGVLNDILQQGMVTTLRLRGRVEKSSAQHHRILDALLVGDPETAARAARAHVRATQAAAVRHVEDQLPA